MVHLIRIAHIVNMLATGAPFFAFASKTPAFELKFAHLPRKNPRFGPKKTLPSSLSSAQNQNEPTLQARKKPSSRQNCRLDNLLSIGTFV